MIPSGSCVGPPLPRCLHVYMLACPLVKLAHLIGRLAARLDLHRRLALGRRVAKGGALRDMVGAGVKTIILHELRGFVLHARRGDRKSTRLNSSHSCASRMPSSA